MQIQVGVKALIANTNDEYLFLERILPMNHETKPHLDIPGGRIESNEALEEALAREIKEETGLELVSIEKLLAAQDIFVLEKDLHVVRLTYAVSAHGKVQISDEHTRFVWLSLSDAKQQNLDTYIRKVLDSL